MGKPWLGGVVVACLTGDCKSLVRLPPDALPDDDSGKVVHTRASVTKQYKCIRG